MIQRPGRLLSVQMCIQLQWKCVFEDKGRGRGEGGFWPQAVSARTDHRPQPLELLIPAFISHIRTESILGKTALNTLTSCNDSLTACPQGIFSKPAHINECASSNEPIRLSHWHCSSFRGRGWCRIFTCIDYYCFKLVTHAWGNGLMSSSDFVCRRTRRCFDKWGEEAGCELEAAVRLSEGHWGTTELHLGRWSFPTPWGGCGAGRALAWCLRMPTCVGTGPPPRSTQTVLPIDGIDFRSQLTQAWLANLLFLLHFNDCVLFILIYFSLTNHLAEQIAWCWLQANIKSNFWKMTHGTGSQITQIIHNHKLYKLPNRKLHKWSQTQKIESQVKASACFIYNFTLRSETWRWCIATSAKYTHESIQRRKRKQTRCRKNTPATLLWGALT